MFFLPLLLALPTPPIAGDPIRVRNAQYELEWPGTRAEAEETLAMLSKAHRALAGFFGSAPTERLVLRVLPDEKSRVEAIWNDRATVPSYNRNAWFSEKTRTSYVARLEGPCATRTNVLYAACMQFHSLAKSKNLDVQSTWQAQGIAIDFARHTWDGFELEPFASPRVEPVELPRLASAALMRAEHDLRKVATADLTDPLIMWGVTALCLHGPRRAYGDAFRRFAIGDKGSKMSTEDFLRTLGSGKTLSNEVHEFLEARQTPFESIGDWSDRGKDGLLASPGPNMTYCVLRPAASRLSARMSALPKTGGRAGLVVGWTDASDFTEIEIEAPEATVRTTREGGQIRQQRLILAGDACRERRIEIERIDGKYVLSIDDAHYTELDLPSGRLGFFASGAEVHFRDVSWR